MIFTQKYLVLKIGWLIDQPTNITIEATCLEMHDHQQPIISFVDLLSMLVVTKSSGLRQFISGLREVKKLLSECWR